MMIFFIFVLLSPTLKRFSLFFVSFSFVSFLELMICFKCLFMLLFSLYSIFFVWFSAFFFSFLPFFPCLNVMLFFILLFTISLSHLLPIPSLILLNSLLLLSLPMPLFSPFLGKHNKIRVTYSAWHASSFLSFVASRKTTPARHSPQGCLLLPYSH